MRFFIYWKNQAGGPPKATIDAESPEEALAQYRRESPYLVSANQLAAETKLRPEAEPILPWG